MAGRKTKTPSEQLKELEKKIEEMQSKKKAIIAKEKKAERAARTRRLIQIGALSEKYFDCPDIEPETYEKMIAQIVALPQVKSILNQQTIEAVKAISDKPETSGSSE